MSADGTRTVAFAVVDAESAPRDALGFACAPVVDVSTAALVPGTGYVLLEMSNGCDSYHDDTKTQIAVVGGAKAGVRSVYGVPPHTQPGGGGADHCYGPLNFYFK